MTKHLYTILFANAYNDSQALLLNIKNPNHIFWQACRDITKELLLTNQSWTWLGYRVDDFAASAEDYIISKLEKWARKGSLCKTLNNLESTIVWLFDRHANTLKNSFDKRYKLNYELSYIIDSSEIEIMKKDDLLENIVLEDFVNFSKKEKIKILTKLWEDNLFEVDFTIIEMEELCNKYAAPPPKTFLNLEYEKNYKAEQTENGNSQLVFIF